MAIKKIDAEHYKLIVSTGSGNERKRKTRLVECTTKREAMRLYNAFEAEVLSGQAPAAYTVAELLHDYIQGQELLGLKATTIKGYNSACARIIPVLGAFPAAEVNSYSVQRFVVNMADKYSPKTIHNTIGLLNAAYTKAVKLGELSHNPCAAVTLPKKAQREISTLDPGNVQRFVSCLENESKDLQAAVCLALFCGLRRSEILGLTTSDVNLTFNTLSIRQSRHVVNGQEIVQTPKTSRSRRTLAMPSLVRDVLRDLLDEHAAQDYETSEFIIQDGFGRPLSPQALNSRLARFEKNNELPRVSLHGLRHTFATMLIHSGAVDIAQVSAELGHSNITTTLNIYMHATGGAGASSQAVAAATDNIILKTGTQTGTQNNKKRCTR